jgi:cold shock CspA family protein
MITGVLDKVVADDIGEWRELHYGFIQAADGRRLFVHRRDVRGLNPQVGDTLRFRVVSEPRGWRAEDVEIVGLADVPAPTMDVQLVCRVCGRAFTWTAERQAFHLARRLRAPRDCQDCRAVTRTDYQLRGVL